MGVIFLGLVGLFLFILFKICYWFMVLILYGLCVGIGVGIGLFIVLIGFKNMGIVVLNVDILVVLGDLYDLKVLLGVFGFFVIVILFVKGIYLGVLIFIVFIIGFVLIFDFVVVFYGIVFMLLSLDFVVG